MCAIALRESAPDPPDDDQALDLITAALAGMPRQDRNEILCFLDFWRELTGEQRALFARSVRPDLTDEQVARLAGVSRRTLYRYQRYQGIKPRLADYRAAKRQSSYTPDDSAC
jgi:AraC-like DNA-binding protein